MTTVWNYLFSTSPDPPPGHAWKHMGGRCLKNKQSKTTGLVTFYWRMTKITAWKRQAGSTLWSVIKYKVVNHIIWHFTWNLAREPLYIHFKTKLANLWSTLQSEIQNSVMGSRPLECDFLHWVSNSGVFSRHAAAGVAWMLHLPVKAQHLIL